jgi:hypothetical protein
MEATKSKAGRPAKYGERLEPYKVGLTKKQRDKLEREGGPDWLRQLIERA